jgi:NADPH:quinone reductase-like Zn-dependent oxidoreductase
LVPLPDEVADEIGAQMLINTVTAITVVGTALEVLSADTVKGTAVLQTAAGSAVGRLVSRLLLDRGIPLIRLVRNAKNAQALSAALPESPVVPTDAEDWKTQVRSALGGRAARVAIDSVAGRTLGDIAELVSEGATIVNFGSLGGGERSDSRLFPPRSLTLKGVMMGSWLRRTPAQRDADIALALRLARNPRGLFDVDGIVSARDIERAVGLVGRPSRVGVVLLRF